MPSIVHIVHCIDTEGPLHESVEATFERLKAVFGLDLEPSLSLLRRLQAGEVDLGGLEEAVCKVVDPHLLAYNDTWDKVDAMLEECTSAGFRDQLLDSDGNGWVYNWFCVDHVDYDANPRRRDMGYHNVFDHYRRLTSRPESARDGLHFHYHPHNFRREAHRCATHWWTSSDSLQQIISRRVIDRQWFPVANRAGFHVTRPDSHWFLEQFIPFDLSNQATVVFTADDKAQAGLGEGRWGDWRRAPTTWGPYHPSHDDYQVLGTCRRWIARCLNVGTRYRLLNEDDVRQAFAEAREGLPVVLAFTNHDFRDIRPDVDEVRHLLSLATRDYPDVLPLLRSRTGDAGSLGAAIGSNDRSRSPSPKQRNHPCVGSVVKSPLQLALASAQDNASVPIITTTSTSTSRSWRYVFDEETFPIAALDSIGSAADNSLEYNGGADQPTRPARSRAALEHPVKMAASRA